MFIYVQHDAILRYLLLQGPVGEPLLVTEESTHLSVYVNDDAHVGLTEYFKRFFPPDFILFQGSFFHDFIFFQDFFCQETFII